MWQKKRVLLMANALLEIGLEEVPARFINDAINELKKLLVTNALNTILQPMKQLYQNMQAIDDLQLL